MEREEETEGRTEGGERERQRSLGCRKQLMATNRNHSNNKSLAKYMFKWELFKGNAYTA